VPDAARSWILEGFLDCLDRWAALESPSDDLRMVVTAWILSRYDDPYMGVRREPGFDNLWFGPVPPLRHEVQCYIPRTAGRDRRYISGSDG
jgi:hypothetical protein